MVAKNTGLLIIVCTIQRNTGFNRDDSTARGTEAEEEPISLTDIHILDQHNRAARDTGEFAGTPTTTGASCP